MASRKSTRVNSQARSYKRYTPDTYEYGNAVRKPDYSELTEPVKKTSKKASAKRTSSGKNGVKKNTAGTSAVKKNTVKKNTVKKTTVKSSSVKKSSARSTVAKNYSAGRNSINRNSISRSSNRKGSAVKTSGIWENVPINNQNVQREETVRPTVSRQTRNNRQRVTAMGRGYVLFLTAVCIAVVGMCVMYLKLQTTLTTQSKQIAAKEQELSELRADNDAYYNETMASIDLEAIKDAALNRLGMHYADESQIIYFDTSGSSYVRQYEDVPSAELKK